MLPKILTVAAISSLLLGCSSASLESSYAMLEPTPAGAEPGFHLAKKGRESLSMNNREQAQRFFCQSAELGNNEGREYCAKLVVINCSKRALRELNNIGDLARVSSYKREICNEAKNGEPAQSVCYRLQRMNNKEGLNYLGSIYIRYINSNKRSLAGDIRTILDPTIRSQPSNNSSTFDTSIPQKIYNPNTTESTKPASNSLKLITEEF